MNLEEMKKGKMVEHMDKMIEVFINDAISEFYYERNNDLWKVSLK